MTREELQSALDSNLHPYVDAKVGRRYVTFTSYWAKGANVGERGNYQGTFRALITDVEKAFWRYFNTCPASKFDPRDFGITK